MQTKPEGAGGLVALNTSPAEPKTGDTTPDIRQKIPRNNRRNSTLSSRPTALPPQYNRFNQPFPLILQNRPPIIDLSAQSSQN